MVVAGACSNSAIGSGLGLCPIELRGVAKEGSGGVEGEAPAYYSGGRWERARAGKMVVGTGAASH